MEDRIYPLLTSFNLNSFFIKVQSPNSHILKGLGARVSVYEFGEHNSVANGQHKTGVVYKDQDGCKPNSKDLSQPFLKGDHASWILCFSSA